MNIKRAVLQRIKQLCKERNITLNTLATSSGITPSTVYSMFNEERKDVGIMTIKKICDGVSINLEEFFSSELFRNLEQEVK